MSSFRIRPRFRQQVNFSIDQIQKKIEREIQKSSCQCNVNMSDTFITISLPESEIQYWSPQLRLTLEGNEDGTLIRGLFGPKQSVWALFFYCYAAIGILAFFADMVWFKSVLTHLPPFCGFYLYF